jgi:hypothetical protein
MEAVSLVVALAPVVEAIYKLHRKIDEYKKIFTNQSRKLRVVQTNLSTFQTLLTSADNTLEELKQYVHQSNQERRFFRKIVHGAKRLARSFQRFLRQKEREYYELPNFLRNIVIGRRWKKDGLEFEYLVWRLDADQGSLHLLIGLAQLRALTQQFMAANMDPRVSEIDWQRLRDRLYASNPLAYRFQTVLTKLAGVQLEKVFYVL